METLRAPGRCRPTVLLRPDRASSAPRMSLQDSRMISTKRTNTHKLATGVGAPTLRNRRGLVPPGLSLLLMAAVCVWMSSARAEGPEGATPSVTQVVQPAQPAAISGKPDREAIKWLPSRGPECVKRGPYKRFCEGPRRVPSPHGAAQELASKLDLGTHKCAASLLLGPPQQ